MKNPSLQHFETFIKVAEYQSFTKTAKHLGVTKAAVSHTIRLLEESFNADLLIRSTRSVRLTDEGEVLFKQCLRLQEELVATRQLVSGFQDTPTGTLRVSANRYLFESELLPTIKIYQQRFPEVQLEFLLDERMLNMNDENIDIIYGINWTPPDDIVARKVGQTRYVLCASPGYLKQHGTPNHINDLLDHQYIAHSGRSPENMLNDLKNKSAPAIRPKISVNNVSQIKQLALNDMGIVQLHDYVVKNELADGSLVEILSDQTNATEISLYIFYQKHRFVQPKIRQFILLLEELKCITSLSRRARTKK